MTDTPAEKLTAEEEKRRAATREALERPMTSSERLRFSLVVAGDDGEWEPDPDDAQGTLDELDASRAETEAVRRERDEAHAAFIEESTDLVNVAGEREALRSLAADLVEGLEAVAHAAEVAMRREGGEAYEDVEVARALLTRAAALGVGKQDGGLAIFDEASDVPARVDRPAAATAAAEGRREGEGVMEDCWYPVVSALGSTGETDPYTLGKAAVDAVHPAIFAAGERAGLEKAAAKMKHLHGGGEADNPHDAGWQAACVAGERAILSLKGGAP